MQILRTTTFARQEKKLHANQKTDLNQAVKTIAKNPSIGDLKKGNLSGVKVYKFMMINQLALLAYEHHTDMKQIILLALGSHENFYRDLQK